MEEIGEKFLPIGTVVMIRGGTKRVMITGYCSVEESEPEEMWDYSGCMYPEGFLSSEETCLFNHDQIENIYYLGLVDEEQEEFMTQLKEMANEL